MKTSEDFQNRTETGQTNPADSAVRAARTHQDYWKPRLKQRQYQDRDGRIVIIPEWQVRMFHLGKEAWFNLETANQAAAAAKARDIFLSLVAAGWPATLAKYKPSVQFKASVCTLGEFLADVGKRGHLRPITVRRYSGMLRRIMADLAKVDAGLKGKALRAKYDHVNGGHKAWLKKVDDQSLSLLTPESLAAWRNEYTARAAADPIARKSAERSAASFLRCSRALFSPDVLRVLKVPLPPTPFAGVKIKDPGPQRYHSDINPEWLLACAARELRKANPQQYLALVLCLWGGLRRKEADTLTWAQIDFQARQIHIRRTAHFEPKTEESQRTVDLAPGALDVLRGYMKGSTSEFVLEGGDSNPTATYGYYRADRTWRQLQAWLKEKGIKQRKAVHALRKESGSLVASAFGIEAARQHLGHRDISTTSAHYVEKRRRIEVPLPAENAGPSRTRLRKPRRASQ